VLGACRRLAGRHWRRFCWVSICRIVSFCLLFLPLCCFGLFHLFSYIIILRTKPTLVLPLTRQHEIYTSPAKETESETLLVLSTPIYSPIPSISLCRSQCLNEDARPLPNLWVLLRPRDRNPPAASRSSSSRTSPKVRLFPSPSLRTLP
jgi:hypothetical protein